MTFSTVVNRDRSRPPREAAEFYEPARYLDRKITGYCFRSNIELRQFETGIGAGELADGKDSGLLTSSFTCLTYQTVINTSSVMTESKDFDRTLKAASNGTIIS